MERLTTKGYEYCSCDFMEDGIYEMANKLSSYEDVGTPEECQDAVEKQKEESPIAVLGIFGGEEYECKNCGSPVEYLDDYCRCCGNKQDWSDFE